MKSYKEYVNWELAHIKKITELPNVIGYKTVKDVKAIHSVASISETDRVHGLNHISTYSDFASGAMLNHRGKAELIRRCKIRLMKQAVACGANAVVNFSCTFSLCEGGSGGDGFDSDQGCAETAPYTCTMLAGGEAVVVQRQNSQNLAKND